MRKPIFSRLLAAAPRVALVALLSSALLPASVAAADDVDAGCHFTPKDGIVSDSATRLSWQQTSSAMLYSWEDAANYCATLVLQGMGWRLPSIKELHTLIDVTRMQPATDPASFPTVVSEYYWTSSQVANFENEVYAVSFAYGYDGFFDVSTKQHVRCVR